MLSVPFVLLSLLSHAFAANDWSTPCFSGVCSYESNEAVVTIWGSSNAISDLTVAGGWTILNCDPTAIDQDIRLVCHDPTTCAHLYQSVGPVGKLVRLPQNCGANAFARVARIWTHQDQTIPSNIASTLRRRSTHRRAPTSKVQGIALDTNFAAVDPQQSGNVNIAVQGSNVPGASGNLTVTPPSRRALDNRGFTDFIESAFNKFNSFDKTVTSQLPPLDVDKTFPLFEQSLSCGSFDASVKADVVTSAHAVVTLGIAASGTLVPPKLSSIGVFAGLDAQLDGKLELKGDATATADSGQLTLFETGIPGLSLPGILELGPSFKILGQATATLDIGVDMTVDLAYNINGAKLFFPASQNHQSGGNFAPGDTPLKLSVTPSLSSKGVVSAHLIPQIDLGISALGDVAKATIFLNLDASASVTLTLDASASIESQLIPAKTANAVASPTAPADAAAPTQTGTDDANTDDANTDDSASTDDSAPTDDSASTDDSDGLGDDNADDQSDDTEADSSDQTDDSGLDNSDNTDDSTFDDNADTSDDGNSGADDDSSEDSGFGDDTEDNSDGLDGADADNTGNDDFGSDSADDDSGTNDDTSGDSTTNDDGTTNDDSAFGDDGTTDSDGTTDDDGFSDNTDEDNTFSDGFSRRADISGSVSGCVDVGAALSVNAGADASFFGLFDKNTKVSLFQKNFDLFKKCFGNGAAQRRSEEVSGALTRRVTLSCPKESLDNVVSLADQTVSGSSLKAQ